MSKEDLTTEVVSGSITLQDGTGELLKLLLPSWVNKAGFRAKKFEIHIDTRMEQLLTVNNSTPFIVIVPIKEEPFSDSGYRPSNLKNCIKEISKGETISETAQNINEEIMYYLNDEDFMRFQHKRYTSLFEYQYQLAPGDGLFRAVKLDFDTSFFESFLAVSCTFEVTDG